MLRGWFDPADDDRGGDRPDYRFSLANERTFLAWLRTGLALVGGGLAVAQFLATERAAGCARGHPAHPRRDRRDPGGRPLGALERAIRQGHDLPPSRFPAVLALIVAGGAGVLIAIAADRRDPAMSGPARPTDQAERTRLSWRRTALAATVVTLLAVRLADGDPIASVTVVTGWLASSRSAGDGSPHSVHRAGEIGRAPARPFSPYAHASAFGARAVG